MLFDTDVLIRVFRGNRKAAGMIESSDDRSVSLVNIMELLQVARDKAEQKLIKSFLADYSFRVFPLTENTGHRAMIYVEEYSLKSGMYMADALIAATAVENNATLCTANKKHYRSIAELDLKTFRP